MRHQVCGIKPTSSVSTSLENRQSGLSAQTHEILDEVTRFLFSPSQAEKEGDGLVSTQLGFKNTVSLLKVSGKHCPFLCLTMQHGVQNVSSQSRDQTHSPLRGELGVVTSREVPTSC